MSTFPQEPPLLSPLFAVRSKSSVKISTADQLLPWWILSTSPLVDTGGCACADLRHRIQSLEYDNMQSRCDTGTGIDIAMGVRASCGGNFLLASFVLPLLPVVRCGGREVVRGGYRCVEAECSECNTKPN
ncbi:hypothetical protein ACSQ67_017406 [Phaseolus vulgaris]